MFCVDNNYIIFISTEEIYTVDIDIYYNNNNKDKSIDTHAQIYTHDKSCQIQNNNIKI